MPPGAWHRPALTLILAVTAARLMLLVFDRTDLFVDESQYWLWGQEFAWGYFSKPPLIGWIIGGLTRGLGSDSIFLIRMPAAILHGVTALILADLAARRMGPGMALPTVAIYLLSPFATLGSLLFTTDTVMLPLFALALWAHARLIQDRQLGWAVLAGLAIGLAGLAKYAAIYGLVGMVLANVFPGARIGWRATLTILAVGILIVMPNLLWNAAHQFTTFRHTATNIGWILPEGPGMAPGLPGALRFLAAQILVFGPFSFPALALGLWSTLRHQPQHRDLALQAALPLAVVLVQSLLGRVFDNWAVAAYLAGSVLAAPILARRRDWVVPGLVLNGLIALVLPVLAIFPETTLAGRQILARYDGRSDLSHQILAASAEMGGLPIVASDRAILADLFYTGRDGGVAIFARPPATTPRNYYEQMHPMPDNLAGEVLWIGVAPGNCPQAGASHPLVGQGAWAGHDLAWVRLPAACLAPSG